MDKFAKYISSYFRKSSKSFRSLNSTGISAHVSSYWQRATGTVRSPKGTQTCKNTQDKAEQSLQADAGSPGDFDSLVTEKNTTHVLIKNGTVVNCDHIRKTDVYIIGNKIVALGSNLDVDPSAVVIDATGMFVMPGGIDMCSKILPTESGYLESSRAALCGGTTLIVNEIYMLSGNSLLEGFEIHRLLAERHSLCDFSFRFGLTSWNSVVAEDISTLCTTKGVTLFKVYTGVENENDLSLLKSCLSLCKQLKGVTLLSPENNIKILQRSNEVFERGFIRPDGFIKSRPVEWEEATVYEGIALAAKDDVPLVISPVMNEPVAKLVAKARNEGKHIFAETNSAALGIDGNAQMSSNYELAARFIMSPPIRTDPRTPGFLMSYLGTDYIQTTGSCHRACSQQEKALWVKDFRKVPQGVSGIQERLAIVWQGVEDNKLSPCRFVEACSSTAAKILNIYPAKGRVEIGSDADLVIFDRTMNIEITSETQHQANIFEGMKLKGAPRLVIQGGAIAVENGIILPGYQDRGKYVPCSANSAYLYGRPDILLKDVSKEKFADVLTYDNKDEQGEEEKAEEVNKVAEKSYNNTVALDNYGDIQGVSIGQIWKLRIDCSKAGAHGSSKGCLIWGVKGAYSICLGGVSGQTMVSHDMGETFFFSPRTDEAKHAPYIAALRKNRYNNTVIRIIRGHDLAGDYRPTYGYRYDGTYQVTSETVEENCVRFGLKRCQGQLPPPWDQENN